MHAVSAYPYLLFSLALFAIALFALALSSGQRRLLSLGGLLALPFGALDVMLIPAYWQPARITPMPFGPEDALFSFSAGVIACRFAFVFFRRRLQWKLEWKRLAKRYLAVTAVFLAGLLAFSRSHMTLMSAVLLSMLGAGAMLLALRRDLWRLPLVGGLGFAVTYVLLLTAAYALWPHFQAQWNPHGLWGIRIFELPLEEIAWALAYGALHPLGIGFILGVRLTEPATA